MRLAPGNSDEDPSISEPTGGEGQPEPTAVERRLAARLSHSHTKHMAAEALANERLQEIEQLRGREQSAAPRPP